MPENNLQSLFPSAEEIPAAYDLTQPIEQKEYLVNGEMRQWKGKTQDVWSPIYVKTDKGFEQKRIGSYPITDAADAMEVLYAGVKAYSNGRGEWPSMTVAQRIECVEKFTQKMIQKRDEVVKLLMWEIGKSLGDSQKEFDRTVQYIYDTIGALKDIDRTSSTFLIEEGIIGQVRRSPLGVVLCMGPFNYPLNETFTTLIPALIMGNIVLFKPPKHGTLLHYPLLEAFKDSFPAGVINTLYGRGNSIIPQLMESGKIDVLTLIGSSKVADKLKKMHPKVNRLRAILGLDAKNAAIVTESADLDSAINECLLGSLSFNGQRCTAVKIIFVHKSLADKFNEGLAKKIETLKLGMMWEPGVQITPLPEPNKPAYLTELIEDAKLHGAKVLNEHGGENFKSIFFPALLYPVNSKMKVWHEEQFGPVVPVVPFESLDEPIDYIHESSHGQQVAIFGTDVNQISELIDATVNQVSRVNINAQCQRGPDSFPFTGRKDSAEGTLSVTAALRSFSIRTVVATKATQSNKDIVNAIVENQQSNFLSTRFIL
ncbi:NADP-dependent glyceraldehyde-3-phosphate dehydrogenase [Aquirufa antheringensis]|jgi:glyceraldehyde-3-phosphate dehydrogenase (NADP+)|uniref:NADP-dependent glyceraldehyde-3-phosphate dehydrogenase n=1 Tax=Aquirufa antheringensis TaxID=2516559 RepID=UPI001032C6B7|nr:NADP-dependent glyceraldehyde-3-phosphate dehydrogenase [Aquirufa antheringensis]MCE4216656.1 aldehyde dehydrogenase family protein [Pseudarcicella sp. GAP-15]MCZ2476634.1 NADP-dependent glyceraldehyde-3-phosphate dehydrogenase [Aquirufa antheringensis]TBH70062.1 NADP-dependent glyceraldehyde-3-phosphate dehydrogenase [Aquirufa antheringensis]USQ02566.1 NADP-dependent glyceraldehyde-3-phosphate dehydrogenase [Aquirufa antheringensis]